MCVWQRACPPQLVHRSCSWATMGVAEEGCHSSFRTCRHFLCVPVKTGYLQGALTQFWTRVIPVSPRTTSRISVTVSGVPPAGCARHRAAHGVPGSCCFGKLHNNLSWLFKMQVRIWTAVKIFHYLIMFLYYQ